MVEAQTVEHGEDSQADDSQAGVAYVI